MWRRNRFSRGWPKKQNFSKILYFLLISYLKLRILKYLKSVIFVSLFSWMRIKCCLKSFDLERGGDKKLFAERGAWSLIRGFEIFKNKGGGLTKMGKNRKK